MIAVPISAAERAHYLAALMAMGDAVTMRQCAGLSAEQFDLVRLAAALEVLISRKVAALTHGLDPLAHEEIDDMRRELAMLHARLGLTKQEAAA